MTTKSKYIFLILSLCLFQFSCNDQEYYQENPNQPSSTTPALLLTGICINSLYNYPLGPAYASRYLTYYERPDASVNYSWTQGSFNEYNVLRQVKKMEELATLSNEENYIGLGKFFRALLFSRLTERFGDIPYSEALQAKEGIVKPKYDSQEDIYLGILKDLDEAHNILSVSNSAIGGDIVYNGDIAKWRKAVTVLKLRTLIHLSKKESNTKLNIKQRFATIMADPANNPLMNNNSDNTQITFNEDAVTNFYPLFESNSVSSLVSLEENIVKIMLENQDPRLFTFGDPIPNKPVNNFSSYAGINAGLIISDQQNQANNASKINKRYYKEKINEPLFYLSFAEQEFIIAEAIQRGWITGPGTAQSHYVTGIKASMQFYAIGGITIEGYLGKPKIKYNAADGLNLIALQKYLAMFCQGDWEPFYEQRRTGVPSFNVGPATLNNGKIPKRWMYPQTEIDNNKENYLNAVERQYGIDNVNGEMWLLK
jgi:hypothetical protein